jgi:hypothetical protein
VLLVELAGAALFCAARAPGSGSAHAGSRLEAQQPAGPQSQGPSLVSGYVDSAPSIDGVLSEWDTTAFVRVTPLTGVFDAESGATDDPDDLQFAFAVANDAQYLYVAVRVTDDVLVLDTNADPADKDARAWMDDALEIFIDGDRSRSPDARDPAGVEFRTGGEFSIVANGAVTSRMSGFPQTNGDPRYWTSAASYPPPAAAAYRSPFDTTVGGFSVEARFAFRVMGEGVGPGDRIGFTVSAHDDDNGNGRDAALYWRGISPSCWKDEAGWGELLLSGPAATPVKPDTFGRIKAEARSQP